MSRSLILAAALAFASPALARACDTPCCSYRTIVCYEKVTCYETRSVPYTKTVVEHDECGRCYERTVTCYRDVRVPVCKVVAVKKRVPVCD